MIITAWNNGKHHASGAGYGFRVDLVDRDRYFRREWGTAVLHLQGSLEPVVVNIDKDSFWGPVCRELISKEIGHWLSLNKMAPWHKRRPPKLMMKSTGANEFDILFSKLGSSQPLNRVVGIAEF